MRGGLGRRPQGAYGDYDLVHAVQETNKSLEIQISFFGPLGEQAGQKTVAISLPEGALYGDLLNEIGNRFGNRFHERIWDSEGNTFKPGILIVGQGRDLDNRKTPLQDGEEIKIIPILSGG